MGDELIIADEKEIQERLREREVEARENYRLWRERKRRQDRALPLAEKRGVSFKDLELSVRGWHACERQGVQTVGDLMDLTPRQMMQWKGVWRGTVTEIRQLLLNDYGVTLRMESKNLQKTCDAYARLDAEERQAFFNWLESSSLT